MHLADVNMRRCRVSEKVGAENEMHGPRRRHVRPLPMPYIQLIEHVPLIFQLIEQGQTELSCKVSCGGICSLDSIPVKSIL